MPDVRIQPVGIRQYLVLGVEGDPALDSVQVLGTKDHVRLLGEWKADS
jgi:hypothetical protein